MADSTTLTRSKVRNLSADAYLVEYENGDVEIVDPDEWTGRDGVPLECLFSVDHGLRCADETDGVIVVNTAAEIMFPLLEWLGMDTHLVDTWAAMAAEIGRPEWEGGWIEDEENLGGRWTPVEILCDLRERVESAAGYAGLVVESNADCGMTWCYRRLAE